MDSPMRRSGIPIPKSKSSGMKKSLSKSNENLLGDSIDPHNQSSELDIFTLLEENIALKEKIEELSAKHNTSRHSECTPFRLFIYCSRFFIHNNAHANHKYHSKTVLQKNIQLDRDNSRVGKQLNDLKVQQKQLKDQLQTLMDKFQKEMEEGQIIHNIQEQQKKIINE